MQQNLGRVVGSKWYTGTGITGTDTTPTVFSGSGVTYALLNDLYLNTTTGAVYQCDLKGSPAVAKWKFICNITGPTPELVNNLRSTDTTKALTANQGKVLNDKLLSSGIYPKSVDLDLETAVYMVDITIQNTDGTITFTSADDSGTYAFTKIGTADTYTITVDIDSSIGFTTTGAILTNIAFTNNIYAIELKDSNADTILEETFNAWKEIKKSLEQVKPSGVITDGELTLNQAKIQKEIDGTKKQVYPITHAKAVWYDVTNGQTVADEIDALQGNFAPIEPTSTASQDYDEDRLLVYNGQLYKVIQAISENDTLVIDTNIEATSIDEVINSGTKLVSWSTGTDEEIGAMIDAYYNGELTIEQIQSVWSIGDVRSITLNAMSATGVGESHRAQNVDVQILDFEHDTLTNQISGKTKALITVDLKNCLRDATVSDTDGANNSENGYMNSSNTNVGGWTSCARRTWCNNVFADALPIYLKNRLKYVNKLTSAGDASSTINTDSDKCFLPSEIEIFGTSALSKAGEGSQYAWYSNADSNRYKLPAWATNKVSDAYWERSPLGLDGINFCSTGISSSGSSSYDPASSSRGIAPAFCL